ncbi:MAG: NnrS family protein, partial [Solirubrobacteraceae bacterium]
MTAARELALFGRGFRPFFALAALQAVGSMLCWLAILSGLAPAPTWLSPSLWHAHEMIFGFALAVIAGFLLTAVR